LDFIKRNNHFFGYEQEVTGFPEQKGVQQ